MAKSIRQKEINFLTALSGCSKRKKINPASLIMPGVLVLLLLIGGGIFALLHINTLQINQESNLVREYINSPDTQRQITQAESISRQAATMETGANATALPMDNLATYPDLTSGSYAQILNYAGINITLSAMSFNRETGILSFSGTSDYVLSIPTFISQLRNSGLFTDVVYTGYSGSVGGSGLATGTSRSAEVEYDEYVYVVPQFAFSVVCVVKPSEVSNTTLGDATGDDALNEAEGDNAEEATDDTATEAPAEGEVG